MGTFTCMFRQKMVAMFQISLVPPSFCKYQCPNSPNTKAPYNCAKKKRGFAQWTWSTEVQWKQTGWVQPVEQSWGIKVPPPTSRHNTNQKPVHAYDYASIVERNVPCSWRCWHKMKRMLLLLMMIVCLLACLFACLVGWLVDLMTDWLTDR